MDTRPAQIATICECIDHSFSFSMWCEEFVPAIDEEDLAAGLDRAKDLVSDATRLQSFLALRKLDDFLRGAKQKPDDLIAADLGVNAATVLGDAGGRLLSEAERVKINKGVAHLTDKLTLDPDGEVDLQEMLDRSLPVLTRLVAELRTADATKEATHWLDQTDALIKRAEA